MEVPRNFSNEISAKFLFHLIFSEELRKFTTKIVRNSLKNEGKICVKIGRLSIPRKSGSYGPIPQTADKDKSAKYIFKYRSN